MSNSRMKISRTSAGGVQGLVGWRPRAIAERFEILYPLRRQCIRPVKRVGKTRAFDGRLGDAVLGELTDDLDLLQPGSGETHRDGIPDYPALVVHHVLGLETARTRIRAMTQDQIDAGILAASTTKTRQR